MIEKMAQGTARSWMKSIKIDKSVTSYYGHLVLKNHSKELSKSFETLEAERHYTKYL